MALSITSVDQAELPFDGGHPLVVTGTFDLGVRYNAYIGLTGTTDDTPCYSGIPGQGNDCYSLDGTTLTIYTPPLWANELFDLLVRAPDVPEEDLLADAITFRVADYLTMVFAMRAVFPPVYKTGPRRMTNLGPLVG